MHIQWEYRLGDVDPTTLHSRHIDHAWQQSQRLYWHVQIRSDGQNLSSLRGGRELRVFHATSPQASKTDYSDPNLNKEYIYERHSLPRRKPTSTMMSR